MQLAALECADEVDTVAQQIGAVNTLVRQSDGSLKGYNTDWSAAITAIENGLQPDSQTTAESIPSQQQDESACSQHSSDSVSGLGAEEATTSGRVFNEGQGERQSGSVLKGRTVVVIGAGGAGKALAFGAAHKGAKVIIANRSVSSRTSNECLDEVTTACNANDTEPYINTFQTNLVRMSANTVPRADLLCMHLYSLHSANFKLLSFLCKVSYAVQPHPTVVCSCVWLHHSTTTTMHIVRILLSVGHLFNGSVVLLQDCGKS